jgi:hypothetical protein
MTRRFPKKATRWYLVMLACILLSFFAFVVGPRLGYLPELIQAAAIMIGLWAPTLGTLGVRSELMDRLDQDKTPKQ